MTVAMLCARYQRRRAVLLIWLVTLGVWLGGVGVYTDEPPVPSSEIEVTPVECWWKTDRGAVVVGERLTLTLTCMLLDAEQARVEIDESGLAASALRLVPFDVLAGERFGDVEQPPWRLIQYRYTVRALGEDLIGRDVSLPPVRITYRVRNMLDGTTLRGREQVYWLSPLALRVLSLVPREADDIRDASVGHLGNVEARRFRAHLWLIVAAVSLSSALMLVSALVARTMRRYLVTRATASPMVSTSCVLRAVGRELRDVESAARLGWHPSLVARALVALRLAGAVALSRPIAQRVPSPSAPPREGELITRHSWRRRPVALAAAVTQSSPQLSGAGRLTEECWNSLRTVIGRFAGSRYGRAEHAEATDLDAVLADARLAVRRLRRVVLVRRLSRRHRPSAEERTTLAWAR